MKRQFALMLALAAALTVTVAPALAGKGGNGNGASGGTSTTPPSIEIATVNGTSAASTQEPAPKLGDNVTFTTVVGSIAGWEYPMVVASCYQDVNGDGTTDTRETGPDIVYGWIDHPDATFLLGAYQSQWTLHGGTATCHAVLYAYGWKKGQETVRFLAATKDWTAGG